MNFIAKSPFLLMSSYEKDKSVDVSPRGGKAGFVKVLNQNRILIPDYKGNNRIDSLINVIETGRIGTLFLIPGINEYLRVSGSAFVSSDDRFLKLFQNKKQSPKTCLVVDAEEMFLHCAKALMRSQLWNTSVQLNRSEFLTMGEMMKYQLQLAEVPRRND